MITIIDYGMGNLGSLKNMFRYLNVDIIIDSDPDVIMRSNSLVLPGVGRFDAAMNNINNRIGLKEALSYKILKEKVPVLGICLGMQLLTLSSEEGHLPGLGFIEALTHRFPDNSLKVPHMGWNTAISSKDSPITFNIDRSTRYYFVHSYYVKVLNSADSLMITEYGVEFNSAIHRDNIFGLQFHPEKSHRFGMKLLKNFSNL